MKLGHVVLSQTPPLLVGALVCWLFALRPAAGIVGDAATADPAVAGPVVLVVSPEGACSGVAVAPDLVLTAAHCVRSRRAYAVSAPWEPSPRRAWALQVVLHRSYSAKPQIGAEPQIGEDLALLKLSLEINPSPAVLSAKDAIWNSNRFVVVGFGRTASGDDRPNREPHSATLVLLSGIPNARRLVLADPATYGKGLGLGACYGDSGGPVFEDSSGRLGLIGIVTSGHCGSITQALVLEPHVQWIVDTATIMGSAVVQL
jgi:hypothetical protein